jgi:hypothetical protein
MAMYLSDNVTNANLFSSLAIINVTAATSNATLSPNAGAMTMNNSDLYSSSSYEMMYVFFVTALIFFIVAPFCFGEERRAICVRRIRERRWIPYDDMANDWYVVMMENRRQQQRTAEYHKTLIQEDEIRLQFLESAMKPYTMVRSIRFLGFCGYMCEVWIFEKNKQKRGRVA